MKNRRFQEYVSKGIACISTCQYKEAIKCFDNALDIDDQDSDLWLEKAQVLIILNRETEALDCYDNALRINPHNPVIWYKKGLLYYELNQLKKALWCYNRALKLNPEFMEALESKKCALSNLEQYDEIAYDLDHPTEIEETRNDIYKDVKTAIITWEHLSEYPGYITNHHRNSRKYKDAWFKDGMDLMNSGRYQEALDCFDAALEGNSHFESALYEKGRCLIFLKKYKKAAGIFAKVIEINGNHEEAWHLKGFAHSQIGEYKEALDCFNKVIYFYEQNHKQHDKLLFHKAYVLYCLKQYDECITCCKKIIKHGGKYYTESRELKNKALMKSGRYEAIIQSYNRRIAQDTLDTTLWYEKGVFLNKIGKYQEAADCFNHIIETDQKDDASYYQRAFAYYHLALYKKALFSIVRAIELYKDDTSYHTLKEKILLKIDKKEE
jgi:tetratricopeptide (TPR) repeat protein